MEERKSPIMEFTSQKQLNKCLREWQKTLFLDHWIISVIISSPKKLGDNWGNNHFVYESNTSLIRLVKSTKSTTNKVMKYCMEQVLVHELLHCKYLSVEAQHPQIEDVHYEKKQHELIDQMAKSLIMVKYNLPFEWFKNFKEK